MAPESETNRPLPHRIRIETEEEVYRYEPANNGAAPLWCMGSSSIVRDGKIVTHRTISEGGEGVSGELPEWGRFHVTAEGRLFAMIVVGGKDAGGNKLAENRLVEIGPDGGGSRAIRIELKHPFVPGYFTATPRAGSLPSDTLELFGECEAQPCIMRYARIHLD
ncbi:MAG: hypothetical protein HY360_13830 [Verrucomicrobia bacterium]|nr:hypothetical protein [Verrucomicrobiota bacterium]